MDTTEFGRGSARVVAARAPDDFDGVAVIGAGDDPPGLASAALPG
jgi:hypothetical protein